MAQENDSAQEPTEPPGERRLRRALAEGQVPRSRELVMACQLLAFSLMVLATVPDAPYMLLKLCHLCFQLYGTDTKEPSFLADGLVDAAETLLVFALPLLVILVAASVVGSLLTGGLIFSPRAVRPKWQKLSLTNRESGGYSPSSCCLS